MAGEATRGPITADEVEQLRRDTPGCPNVIHLNNAGSALPPAIVTDTQVEHLRLEERIGGYEAHDRAMERIGAVSASIAALVDCRPDQVALVESATAAWSRGFAAIQFSRPIRSGQRILVSSAEYASNVIPAMQLARHTGARVEFIPDAADGTLDVAAFSTMLDDDVAVVAVNHCPSQNGLINDVAAVGAVLRDRGSAAWYVVDACQSVGQLPVSAREIGADVLTATGRKFLRGPRGTGFLVVSDRALAELEPFPLDLKSATWESDGYVMRPSAERFESWEKSYAALLGMGAAIDYALGIGIDRIAERIQGLAEEARTGLAAVPGVTVRDRGRHRSGIVTITHDRMPAPDLAAALAAAGINVSLSTPDYSRVDFDRQGISGLVRISPHVYNRSDDVARLVDTVAGLG